MLLLLHFLYEPLLCVLFAGICRSVYKQVVKAHSGDKFGDMCIFPFDYKGVIFNLCIYLFAGICRAVYKQVVKAHGGDKVGDTCIFPFDYKGVTFNSCVEDDIVRH